MQYSVFFYVIRHVLHVFNLCTGGLNQTKVQLDKADSIDTHKVHLSTVLIHFKVAYACAIFCIFVCN